MTRRAIARIADRHGVDVLVLHGSRARDDAGPCSDWDFGFLSRSLVEVDALNAELATVLGCDRIDVANLSRASALLRYRAARDGIPIYEAQPGTFARFWLESVRFWLDAAPVLARGYEDILARLGH